jgi:hypothetical protein
MVGAPYAAKLAGTGAGEVAFGSPLKLSSADTNAAYSITGVSSLKPLQVWSPGDIPNLKHAVIKKVIDRTPLPARADTIIEQHTSIPECEMVYFDPSGLVAIPEEDRHAELPLQM